MNGFREQSTAQYESDMKSADDARAARNRKLVYWLFAFLLFCGLAFASCPRAAEPEGWTQNDAARSYVVCRKTLVDDHDFCVCMTRVLVHITKSPAQLKEADVKAAIEACPAPKPPPKDVTGI